MKTRLLGIGTVIAVAVCLALVGIPRGSRALEPDPPASPATISDGELEQITRNSSGAVRVEAEVVVAHSTEPELHVPAPRLSGEVVVYGRVTDPEGIGIPNAQIFVVEKGDGGWITNANREFGRGITSEDGNYSIPCPKLDVGRPIELRSKQLIIYSEREGYSRGWRLWSKWPPISEPLQDIRRDFRLEPGRWVHGRVLAADGAPVAGARVWFNWKIPGGDGYWKNRPSTDAAGVFRLPFPPNAEVRRLWIQAWKEGVAEVDLRDRNVSVGEISVGNLELGDIVLEQHGTLSGVVVFPNGRPAARVRLLAVPVELRGSRMFPTDSSANVVRPPKDGSRLPQGRGLSDENGRFRIAGLQPGSYTVFPLSPGTEKGRRFRPVDDWFPTGSRDILVEIANCLLVVELIDGAGHALSRVDVMRDEVTMGDDGEFVVVKSTGATASADGIVTFAVEPGATYAVHAVVRRLGSAAAQIEIPLDATEVRHQLVLVVDRPEPASRE